MAHDPKLPKPGLTIVGGQPKRERVDPTAQETEVPVGFEMLLYRAAREPAFRQRLLANRTAAVAESGIPLRPSEQTTLEAVSDAMLEQMIERLQASSPQRSRLMVNVAAAVTSLAAGTAALGALGSCGEDETSRPVTMAGVTSTTDTTTATLTTTPTGVGGVSAGVNPGGTGGTPWLNGGGGQGGGPTGGGGGQAGGG